MMQHNEGCIFILKQKSFCVNQRMQATRQTSDQHMKLKWGIPEEISVFFGGIMISQEYSLIGWHLLHVMVRE